MKINRRTFLQGAGFTFASLGGFFGETILPQYQLNRYSQALGASNSRKLALLVGINQYASGNENLRGCVTDVELQRELLVSRFGFNPSDILTLINEKASRESILNAFDEHLAKQVKENDVVVFHFSGYGRQVRLNEGDGKIGESLITHGSSFKGDGSNDDILLDSLISLFQTLKTSRYTLVLDTSYQPFEVSTTTKLWLRSYHGDSIPLISGKELAFNQDIKQKNKKSNSLLRGKDKSGGVIFTSATEGLATEITSNSFNAGLFTYSLTHSLWQSVAPINNLILSKKVAANIALINGELQYTNITLAIKNDLSPYYLMADEEHHGDIVITNASKGNSVEFDLVGLPLLVLFNYGIGSCFSTEIDLSQNVVIQVNSLMGNKGKGFVLKGVDKVESGMVLREAVRVIPRDVDLMVGLDSSLQRIERVDATSALTSVGDFKAINVGDNYADCILGKLTSNGSYGLFSQAGVLLPNTMAKTANEAVSTAVKRLGNALQNKLAQKLLNLTLNGSASRLPVRVGVEYFQNKQGYVSYQKTLLSKGFDNASSNVGATPNISQQKQLINISAGSSFSISIYNENDYDLYYMIMGFNASGRAIAYFSTKNVMVNARETFTIPDPQNTIKLIDNGNQGIGELIIICSQSPFNNTFNQLYKNSKNSLEEESIIILENPASIAQSILLDLHEGSGVTGDLVANLSDVYALDLSNWASFNFIYEIGS
ncbi:caspase family protein [Cyanobacterium stanieri LEGE 03274]|uniref:Caspase family protein n=1 Tax=Cyanobacterium stanieri LEGE 03274 TaxID=1828756 RepID=A0ABR9V155_9CHRO|nr:caspase family protein [Cyanobacterium stanieri]MBE9221621.1 caspase family protein [Cyanobacterium stanieri LEGE 03274]